MHKLSKTPGIGHLRRDLAAEPLHFWRVCRYLIIYRSEAKPVQIARVLHAAQDVEAILAGRQNRPNRL
jgi:plasmid stabilization system protein ParE